MEEGERAVDTVSRNEKDLREEGVEEGVSCPKGLSDCEEREEGLACARLSVAVTVGDRVEVSHEVSLEERLGEEVTLGLFEKVGEAEAELEALSEVD